MTHKTSRCPREATVPALAPTRRNLWSSSLEVRNWMNSRLYHQDKTQPLMSKTSAEMTPTKCIAKVASLIKILSRKITCVTHKEATLCTAKWKSLKLPGRSENLRSSLDWISHVTSGMKTLSTLWKRMLWVRALWDKMRELRASYKI